MPKIEPLHRNLLGDKPEEGYMPQSMRASAALKAAEEQDDNANVTKSTNTGTAAQLKSSSKPKFQIDPELEKQVAEQRKKDEAAAKLKEAELAELRQQAQIKAKQDINTAHKEEKPINKAPTGNFFAAAANSSLMQSLYPDAHHDGPKKQAAPISAPGTPIAALQAAYTGPINIVTSDATKKAIRRFAFFDIAFILLYTFFTIGFADLKLRFLSYIILAIPGFFLVWSLFDPVKCYKTKIASDEVTYKIALIGVVPNIIVRCVIGAILILLVDILPLPMKDVFELIAVVAGQLAGGYYYYSSLNKLHVVYEIKYTVISTIALLYTIALPSIVAIVASVWNPGTGSTTVQSASALFSLLTNVIIILILAWLDYKLGHDIMINER